KSYALLVSRHASSLLLFSFFFTAPATAEIYTLSLHDALPISSALRPRARMTVGVRCAAPQSWTLYVQATVSVPGQYYVAARPIQDRKSTRLNSSHVKISYAVFCLKKKKKTNTTRPRRPPNNQP